jgi:hypothetical protein
MSYKETIESFLKVIDGKTFVKSATYNQEQLILFLTFYNSYSEYLSYNKESLVTETDYNSYFDTGSKIEKLLIGEPAKILMQFPKLNSVSVVLNFKGENFDVDVDRVALNNSIGFKIEDTSFEDGTFHGKFYNVFVSGVRNDKRSILVEKFRN